MEEKKPSNKKPPKKKLDYRQLNVELAEVLGKLESDQLDVDDSIALYERGMTIVTELQAYLKTAENSVQKVQADWNANAS